MDQLILTYWQRRHLQQQLRQAAAVPVYRRTLALLELDRGRPVAEVAQAVGVSRQSVYNWVAAYVADHDPAALAEGSRSGRPSAWTDELRAALEDSLGQAPDRLGYPAVNWTVPLLQEHLEHRCGARLAANTVRRELHRRGYVWKRSRYVLDPDPERDKKNAASAGSSVGWGRGMPCWRRTRRTCCCSRRSAPAGRCGGNGRRCGCPAGMPAGCSSGR